MKNRSIFSQLKVFATILVLPVLSFAAEPSANGTSGISESLQFVLNSAHKQAFTACDKTIISGFSNVAGDDVRVEKFWFDETKQDSLGMILIWGSLNDTVIQEGEFRKVGSVCLGSISSHIIENQSCTSYLAKNQLWKLESETVGVLTAKNKGGITLILKPIDQKCVLLFKRTIG